MSIRDMGAGPVASTILAGATLQGNLTQAAGQILLATGTAAAPSVAFSAQTDAGLYKGTVGPALASAGTQRMHVTNPIDVIINLALGAGLRVDGETAKTANYTVTTSDVIIPTNSAGGGFTVTLPASPGSNQVVIVKDATGSATGANSITIARNGKTIDGAAADSTINVAFGAKLFWYDGTGWLILGVK